MQETFGPLTLLARPFSARYSLDTLCGTRLDSSVKAKPFSTLHWHNPELICTVHGFPSHAQAPSIDLTFHATGTLPPVEGCQRGDLGQCDILSEDDGVCCRRRRRMLYRFSQVLTPQR